MGRLAGKIALVTGGSTGIGRATAVKFLQEGAQVIIADINQEQGKATAEALGDAVHFFAVNVADAASVETLFNFIREKFGRLDILVNNAGIVRDSTLKKLTEEDFEKVIDVNLKGVFLCTKKAAELMRGEGGVILNASSVVAHFGNFGQTNYVAAKAGVIGMTKVWARELGKSNIRVNAVAPGFVQTDMIAAVPDKVLDLMADKVSLHRLGMPQDIANMYCFLASDEASYITGAVFNVDGGLTI